MLEFFDIFSNHENDLDLCITLKHRIDIPLLKTLIRLNKSIRRQPDHYHKIIDEKIDAILKHENIAANTFHHGEHRFGEKKE